METESELLNGQELFFPRTGTENFRVLCFNQSMTDPTRAGPRTKVGVWMATRCAPSKMPRAFTEVGGILFAVSGEPRVLVPTFIGAWSGGMIVSLPLAGTPRRSACPASQGR